MSISTINSLQVSDENRVITWEYGNEAKSLDVGYVHQVEINEKGTLIFAIIGEHQGLSELVVLQGNGKLVSKVSNPNNFYFSYISHHPEFGQCVICSTDIPIDGWNDWYFSIDIKRGLLVKRGPSY